MPINLFRRQFFTLPVATEDGGCPPASTEILNLWSWGDNSAGQLGNGDLPTDAYLPEYRSASWTAINTTYRHSLGLKDDGTIWAWGEGNGYKLATGDELPQELPVQIGAGTSWVRIAAGASTSYMLNSIGEIWGVGSNSWGQLAMDEDLLPESLVPIQMGTDSDWSCMVSGDNSVQAIKTDGTLWAWGYNEQGQCGIDPNLPDVWDIATPTQIGTDSDWWKLAAHNVSCHCIKRDGSLWGWGSNYWSNLGFPYASDWKIETPVNVSGGFTWLHIAAGWDDTYAIKTDGTLWGCGRNDDYALGLGFTGETTAFTQIGGDNDWLYVQGGDWFALGIKTDGSLWGWGKNTEGRLGSGLGASSLQVPTLIHSGNWDLIQCGQKHTLALTLQTAPIITEFLYTWGLNDRGQLGDGTLVSKNIPTKIGTDEWLLVKARGKSSAGIKLDGTLWTWGANDGGILGLGDEVDKFVPTQVAGSWKRIAIGGGHMLGIKDDDTLWSWGDNLRGQLGINSVVPSLVPLQVGIAVWLEVACGGEHSAGVKVGGDFFVWGRGSEGQTGVNFDTSDKLFPIQGKTGFVYDRVACSRNSTYAGTFSGLIPIWYVCGEGLNHLNGNNTTSNRDTWVQDMSYMDILSASLDTLLVRTQTTYGADSAHAYGYGKNTLYHLGLGNTTTPIYRTLLDSGTRDFTSLHAGDTFSIGVKLGLQVYGFGNNSNGELGNGSFASPVTTPTFLDAVDWETISCGGNHSLGIKKES